jgi:hypothetical protein
VGAAKWERAASKEGVGTVAFSVAFILTLRWKVISVIVTRFDNICNNFIRLTHKLVAKFCAVPTPFRDHLFGLNQLTRGLSFLQSARTGRECHKPGLLHARIYNSFRFRGFHFGPKWTQNGANNKQINKS